MKESEQLGKELIFFAFVFSLIVALCLLIDAIVLVLRETAI